MVEIVGNEVLGLLRLVRVEALHQLARHAQLLQGRRRGQAGQLGAERLGTPEIVAQQPPPAPRHRQRLEQRREEAEIADPELEVLEPRLAQRLDDQRQHRRIVVLAIGGGEGLDAGLAELARVGAVGAAGLVAEGRAAVAVARRHAAAGVARQVQPAGRHGQVGAQAQLLAVGIGEHVGARAQGLADHVEEQARGLDDAGRHLLVAGAAEGGEQPLRLVLQGLELLCGFRGHGSRRCSPQ